jgi:hypothetical protein
METFTLGLDRCWIIRALGRNPLVRVSDRLEAILRIGVLATALFVAPVAGAIGTAVYDAHVRLYLAESQTRHTVIATAIDDSAVSVQRYSAGFRATARWQVDGIERVGSVNLDHEVKAGDPQDVWVDDEGNQVAAPTPTSRAGVDAVSAGAAAWVSAVVGAAGLSAWIRARLMRRRYNSWDRELEMLVNDGGGRTGSQT